MAQTKTRMRSLLCVFVLFVVVLRVYLVQVHSHNFVSRYIHVSCVSVCVTGAHDLGIRMCIGMFVLTVNSVQSDVIFCASYPKAMLNRLTISLKIYINISDLTVMCNSYLPSANPSLWCACATHYEPMVLLFRELSIVDIKELWIERSWLVLVIYHRQHMRST